MRRELTVVIGIATAGRREQMALTLAQIARQRRLPERIVICPAGADDYDERASALVACPVEVVHGPRGLTAQRNAILAACGQADVVIFMDDDYYPAPDYVAQVLSLFVAHPDIVVATNHPVVDGASGPGVPHDEAVRIVDALPAAAQAVPHIKETYGGYGCNMAVRLAPAREHAILFDANLPLYGWLEDIDFSRRMAAHGRIANCSSLRGVHLATKRGRTSGLRFGYSQVANPVYLLRKGSLSLSYAAKHIAKNVAKNMAMVAWPESWVDRRGRLKGNWLALRDWLRGELDPARIQRLL
ncbi:glycosyltransferase family 2 protein [Piscinibacter sp.]|jgi:GT2 family glycosyltransferase|uniref:glycosyltransferase family 2 protein n=1 Tax=Piscinibacter sp. TaxID=1903157 RepID=UPI002F3F88F9